jgi:hypothetical protein
MRLSRGAIVMLPSIARNQPGVPDEHRSPRPLVSARTMTTASSVSAVGTAAGPQFCERPLKAKFAADSPLEGSGFEPSVPLPRLSSIRAVRAEIIGRSTDVFRRDREFNVSALSTSSQSQCSTAPGLIAGTWHRPLFLTRDRWFESGSLQRRVRCEPDFRGRILSMAVRRMTAVTSQGSEGSRMDSLGSLNAFVQALWSGLSESLNPTSIARATARFCSMAVSRCPSLTERARCYPCPGGPGPAPQDVTRGFAPLFFA